MRVVRERMLEWVKVSLDFKGAENFSFKVSSGEFIRSAFSAPSISLFELDESRAKVNL